MNRNLPMLALLVLFIILPNLALAQIPRIWLTHRSNEPNKIVVNWTTDTPGDSVVQYWTTLDDRREIRISATGTLHHVEIPLVKKDTIYHYTVATAGEKSAEFTFKGYPTNTLRVAVVANWQAKPQLNAIIDDDPHLLLTAGDNIDSLHQLCGVGVRDCIKPYCQLIDAYPELFHSIPFMPVLGNHDREIRPRGVKPPVMPVYDIEATAFRTFFELPDDEWRWHFDIPEFGVRFIALDFNHISDIGTTWQSCHPISGDSNQYEWYQNLMVGTERPFVVTLYNERNASIRNQVNGQWHRLFRMGAACITGFGHYGERAELDGVLYFNTSLYGRGDRYPDPCSKVLKSEDNYLLLTFRLDEESMRVEMKGLDGTVLDSVDVPRRD